MGFSPTYCIHIDTTPYEHEGALLIVIINFLKEILRPHIWYVGQREWGVVNFKVAEGIANGLNLDLDFRSALLTKIGDDDSLIKICANVFQFVWVEFLAIDASCNLELLNNVEVIADGADTFDPLEIEGVLIEIKSHDGMFLEICSENKEYLEYLAKKLDANFFDFIRKDE